MHKFWTRFATVVAVLAGTAVLVVGVVVYPLFAPKYQDRRLDPLGPQYQLSRQDQLKVTIYDTKTRTFSAPVTRQMADAEIDSGLHPDGQIATRRGLPDVDATDIKIRWH